MNKLRRHNSNKTSFTFFVMFMIVLLFNVSVFSQSTKKNCVVSTTNKISNDVERESGVRSPNLELILWFMGSKQSPNSTISEDGINTKKQIITSGLAPNRLLIKAFLKKAVNFERTLA